MPDNNFHIIVLLSQKSNTTGCCHINDHLTCVASAWTLQWRFWPFCRMGRWRVSSALWQTAEDWRRRGGVDRPAAGPCPLPGLLHPSSLTSSWHWRRPRFPQETWCPTLHYGLSPIEKGDVKKFKFKTLLHIQLWSKNVQTFFKWCQTPKSWLLILVFIKYVKYLQSYLQKTWRGGLTNLKFCVLANQLVPKKKSRK